MEFNEQQLQVINSNAEKIVCIASAGAGKTSTLLARIHRLINDGVQPDSMLILTFTNAAAQELTDRYQRDYKTGITPKFCTFHAFCYSLIASDINVRSALGYKNVPDIGTEEDFRKYWILTKQICNVKLTDPKLKGSRDNLAGNDQFVYDIFWKAYKRQICEANIISFDIMQDEVSKLFVDNNGIVQKYKDKYKYIAIDEFQDTEPKEWAFAESFTGANIFTCGDPQQMLYRFRGCTNAIIKKLAENPEYELIKLPFNYRSTKQIVEYANGIFAERWGEETSYYIRGKANKDGEPIEFCDSFPKEADKLLPVAVRMTEAVNKGKSVAILCRTNAEVADTRTLFTKLNIPIRGKSDNSDIIGILNSSISSEYCVNWLASLLPNEDYARYLRLSTLDPTITEEQKFIQTFGGKFARILEHIYKCRTLLSENKIIFERMRSVISYLRLNVPLNIKDHNFLTLQEGIDYIVDVISVALESGIYIGTIHSVKGLEYDIVHVIGVDGPSFQTDKNEDEAACFYVACTRAKEKLYLWLE